ncbi:GNAT family N-acetyltransferase [Methylocella sp.]|jgi:lipid II:glycine glycyltransferase (peptidoglycan interpeptide bridge formation enzyme)|uniref:GNAT family N-acetyltransferase n=1 Tax=Methylocella sp. TaxID=1978226 RepID=UPI003C188E3A
MRAYNRASITRELIAKLPPAAIYHYKCESALIDVWPFVQQGFVSSVQFTQEILPSDPSIIWADMSKKKRSQIRRAQALVTLSLIDDPERFWNFYDTNLERRGERNYYTKSEVESCIKQVFLRRRGRIYAAKDVNNNLVAAILCVWDRRTSYYYMSSRTAAAHDGAVSLLLWQAIQDAAEAGLIFDFDGLNDIATVEFYRGFGGRMVPRLNLTRTSAIGHLAWKFIKWRHARPALAAG